MPLDFRPFLHHSPKYSQNFCWFLARIVLRFIVCPVRIVILFHFLLGYWFLVRVVPALRCSLRLRQFSRHVARVALCLAGARLRYVSVDNVPVPPPLNPTVPILISNHISYLDVLVLMALHTPAFLAKGSIRRVPVIGFLADAWQCLYTSFDDALQSASSTFPQAHGTAMRIRIRQRKMMQNPILWPPLCIFPEGTTTNGRFLIPFKTGAFIEGLPVQPLIISYSSSACAWETIPLLWHLWDWLSEWSYTITVCYLPVYYPSSAECRDPSLYAHNIRIFMQQEYNKHTAKFGLPPLELSDATIETKKALHNAIRKHNLKWDQPEKVANILLQ